MDRWKKWSDYLNEPALSRGQIGNRILEARTAGYGNGELAEMLNVSVGYISSMASAAKKGM